LKKKGELINDADILIASIVKAHDAILVTNNEKHFSRVEGLKIENWLSLSRVKHKRISAKDESAICVPDCSDEKIREVADVIRSRWLTTGSQCARFEKDPSSSCRKFRRGCTASWLGCGGKEGAISYCLGMPYNRN